MQKEYVKTTGSGLGLLQRFRHRRVQTTLERWYYRALGADDPVAAFERKARSDLGKATAIGLIINE